MKKFTMRYARAGDLATVREIIDAAAKWLDEKKDTDQWQTDWPTEGGREERIAKDIESSKTWIAWDGNVAAATITIEPEQNGYLPELWDDDVDDGPAVSVHRVVVNRSYSGIGLGAALLNWAADRAAALFSVKLIRIDVWTTNLELHEYYKQQGFEFVRYHSDKTYPSGALFQRAVTTMPDTPEVKLETDDCAA